MNELKIAERIAAHRKEKGMTQEALAEYMGVSKASVSKWETAQSCPDIASLPVLAAYFNTTTDELLGYEAEMSREEIRTFYRKMGVKVRSCPFEEVYQECETAVRKYASCYPFLVKVAVFYVNHIGFCKDEKLHTVLLEEAAAICQHAKRECKEVTVAKEAELIEAMVYLLLKRPQEVLHILGENLCPINQENQMVAKAYEMLGKYDKSIEAAQVGMYQYLIGMMCQIPDLLLLNRNNMGKMEEILHRAVEMERLYHMDTLHPSTMMSIYGAAAEIFLSCEENGKALKMLARYADIGEVVCRTGMKLKGNVFFDRIDTWLTRYTDLIPLDEEIVRGSIVRSITQNPVFHALNGDNEFEALKKRLEELL